MSNAALQQRPSLQQRTMSLTMNVPILQSPSIHDAEVSSTIEAIFDKTTRTGAIRLEGDLTVTSEEWQQIQQFCEEGQTVLKHTTSSTWRKSHHRRVQILNNDTLSWGSNHIPLKTIHAITVGRAQKSRLFSRTNASLCVSFAGDSRSLNLEFRAVPHRNFWITAILLYKANLEEGREYVKSFEQLEAILNYESVKDDEENKVVSAEFSPDGKVQPVIAPSSDAEIEYVESEPQKNGRSRRNSLARVMRAMAETPNILIDNDSIESTYVMQPTPPHSPHNADPAVDMIPPPPGSLKNSKMKFFHVSAETSDVTVERVGRDFQLDLSQIPRMEMKQHEISAITLSEVTADKHTLYVFGSALGDRHSDTFNQTMKDCPNATAIHVAWCDGQRKIMSDLNFDENISVIEKDLKSLISKIKNSEYTAISIPVPAIGTRKGFLNLSLHAPRTFQCLKEQLQTVLDACVNSELMKEVRVENAESGVPMLNEPFAAKVPKQKKRRSQILKSLAVDELNPVTKAICRRGVVFRTHISATVSYVQHVQVDVNGSSLIGDDLFIPFNSIVSLSVGKHPEFPKSTYDPKSTLIVEHRLNGVHQDFVQFVALEAETKGDTNPTATRNWWINAILSYIASTKTPKFPLNVRDLHAVLLCESIAQSASLRFVTLKELRSQTPTFELDVINEAPVTKDEPQELTEKQKITAARKRALERVRKVKQLQKLAKAEEAKEVVETVPQESSALEVDTTAHELLPIPEHSAKRSMAPSPPAIRVEEPDVKTFQRENKDARSKRVSTESKVVSRKGKQRAKLDSKHVSESSKSPSSEMPPAEKVQPQSSVTVDTLKKLTKELVKKVQSMEESQEVLQSKIEELVQRGKKDKLVLERKLSNAKSEAKFHKAKHQELQKKFSELNTAHEKLKNEKLVRKWKDEKGRQRQHAKLQAAFEEQKAQLRELTEKHEHSSNAFAILQKRLQSRDAQVLQMQQNEADNVKKHVEQMDKMSNRVDMLSRGNKMLRTENELFKSQLMTSQALNNELRARAGDTQTKILTLEEETERLTHELDACRVELQAKVLENSNLHDHQNEINSGESKIELARRNAELVSEVEGLQQALCDSEVALESHLERENAQKREILKLRQQVETDKQRAAELEKIYQKKLLDFTEYAQSQMEAHEETILENISVLSNK